jgi:hypothetical protein
MAEEEKSQAPCDHRSDCAVHNEPYAEAGPCDCRETEQYRCLKCDLAWPEMGSAVRHVQYVHSDIVHANPLGHRGLPPLTKIAERISKFIRKESASA